MRPSRRSLVAGALVIAAAAGTAFVWSLGDSRPSTPLNGSASDWTPQLVPRDWGTSPPSGVKLDDMGPTGIGLLPPATAPAQVHPLDD